MPKTFSEKEEELFDNEWSRNCWGYNIEGSAREASVEHRRDQIKYFLHQSHLRLLEEGKRLLPEEREVYNGADTKLVDGFNSCLKETKDRLAELKKEI